LQRILHIHIFILTSCDFHNQWLYLGELFLYDGFLNKLLICLFIICILIVCHQHNNHHAVGHWDDLLLGLDHEVMTLHVYQTYLLIATSV